MSDMIPITPDVLDKWRAEVTVGPRRHFHPDHVHALLDHIAKVEAERDTLAEIVRLLNVSVEPCAEGETVWWLITDDWFDHTLTPERAERFRALLDPPRTVSDDRA